MAPVRPRRFGDRPSRRRSCVGRSRMAGRGWWYPTRGVIQGRVAAHRYFALTSASLRKSAWEALEITVPRTLLVGYWITASYFPAGRGIPSLLIELFFATDAVPTGTTPISWISWEALFSASKPPDDLIRQPQFQLCLSTRATPCYLGDLRKYLHKLDRPTGLPVRRAALGNLYDGHKYNFQKLTLFPPPSPDI